MYVNSQLGKVLSLTCELLFTRGFKVIFRFLGETVVIHINDNTVMLSTTHYIVTYIHAHCYPFSTLVASYSWIKCQQKHSNKH